MKKLLIVLAFMSLPAFGNSVAEGRFKLYSEPGFKPNAGCDVHTSLILDNSNLLGSFAVVENGLDGFCEIYVHPNTKLFRIIETETSCGSKYYEGEFYGVGQRLKIEITDHRSRVCRDVVPARVIITIEDLDTGKKDELFSSLY
jgi:hypothetical protein